jgi:di/tricarboxylate transporter
VWETWFVFGVLAVALVLFVTEWLRYDAVAILALITVTAAGIIPIDRAFMGFGHPAVITVAVVLVLSRGLVEAGVVSTLAGWSTRFADRPVVLLTVLTGMVALASAFVNNIGALALLLPVALRLSREHGHPPSMLLMPMAFGSLLGGLTTLIGTPPNIIIATFRADATGEAFRMFDFTPVGAGVAVAAVAFICLGGWKLVPKRRTEAEQDLFKVEEYLAEVAVPEGSEAVGKGVHELQPPGSGEVVIAGLFRDGRKVPAPRHVTLQAGDVLVLEADTDSLERFLERTKLGLVEREAPGKDAIASETVTLVEAVVPAASVVEHRTARGLDLRRRFGINLLAIGRRGMRLVKRVGAIPLKAGDVVLLQGPVGVIDEATAQLGLLPLAPREIRLGPARRRIAAVALFAGGIALAALGILPAPVALLSAALAMVLVRVMRPSEAYAAIDLKLLVLLGAMIPVGEALETSGGADLLAGLALRGGDGFSPILGLAIVLVTTMILSDVVNNAAAAVLMAPVALGVAAGLGASVDPFLMAVAVGASCAFLTPIGHQSNTLVMGPGGYRFGDYWRLGLPVQVVVGVVALTLIVLVWPPFPG